MIFACVCDLNNVSSAYYVAAPPDRMYDVLLPVADPKILKRGRKTIYHLRPHLSQMRTTKYMPFTQKKLLFEQNMI